MEKSSYGNSLTDHGIRKPRSGRCSNKAAQVVSMRNPCKSKFNIGTWNVRTMLKPGKLDELNTQMIKADIDILGICETRWAGNGDYIRDDLRIIHSGKEKRGSSGVAIVLKGQWKGNILNTYHLSDRIIMIKIAAQPTNLYVIQVYFPTSNSTDEEIYTIYEQLEELLSLTEEKSNVILMGDFNACVGSSSSNQECVGKFGHGIGNTRGEYLMEFSDQNDMIITNTMFQVLERRKYTWKAPGDLRRFQIDYIIVKKRYRNQVTSIHSYPGSKIDSDHCLVKAKCNIRFKKRNIQRKKKWAIDKLKEEGTKKIFHEELAKKNEDREPTSWETMKINIKETSDKVLGKQKYEPRKPWMTEKILDLIEERNKVRKQDYIKYKEIKNKITEECRKAKNNWLEENCKEIEYCLSKNNADRAYNKVKSLQTTLSTRSNIVKDKQGNILFENDKVSERWKEYMEELYEGEEIQEDDKYIEKEKDVNPDELGPPITRDEFNFAMRNLSEKKATGVDEIPAEILKNIDDNTKDELFRILKQCYQTGILPTEFIKSKCITIPKKGNASDCSNYRTISILSHTSKILLNIVKTRLKGKIESQLGDDQFGFRREKGTREAILALKQILERRIDVNLRTYVTFIDLEKAFDKVEWTLLFETLKKRKIDWKDRRLILNLYRSQTTIIDVNGVIKEAKIRKGVRQGCPISPYLFNIFIEEAMNEMKEETSGVKINGHRIHSIRFADDIALVAETENEMNEMLNILAEKLTNHKLKINATKTKTMIIRKESDTCGEAHIHLGPTPIQQVKEFCYLGSIISESNKTIIDIKRRIGMAKQAFMKKYSLLTSKHFQIETRKKFIKTFIWSILIYGCETWTLGENEKNRLKAVEMWLWRKMTKTSWTERKTNEKVLQEIGERRNLLGTILKRKTKLIGHLIRHNSFIENIFEGRLQGKRSRGRPRTSYFGDINNIMGVNTYWRMKRKAMDREEWLSRQGLAFRI